MRTLYSILNRMWSGIWVSASSWLWLRNANLLFDTYHALSDFSLKDGAREDRAQNALGTTAAFDYEIYDEMSIKETSLNVLFSNTPTTRRLTKYLGVEVLDEYENSPLHAVIATLGTIAINKSMSFLIHSWVTAMRKLIPKSHSTSYSVLSTTPSPG